MSVQIVLPIFGGQGLATSGPTSSRSTAPPSTSPSCALLLQSCHAALLEEIACLKTEDQKHLGICAQDFSDQNSVTGTSNTAHCDNPALSGTILLLNQALQFLAYIDSASDVTPSSKPILDALKISHNSVGITGFSSGIFTACVVASSPSIPSFIVNCVEAYKLALWLGIRSKLHQISSISSQPSGTPFPSWSLVLAGINKADTLCAIQAYHSVSSSITTF